MTVWVLPCWVVYAVHDNRWGRTKPDDTLGRRHRAVVSINAAGKKDTALFFLVSETCDLLLSLA